MVSSVIVNLDVSIAAIRIQENKEDPVVLNINPYSLYFY